MLIGYYAYLKMCRLNCIFDILMRNNYISKLQHIFRIAKKLSIGPLNPFSMHVSNLIQGVYYDALSLYRAMTVSYYPPSSPFLSEF